MYLVVLLNDDYTPIEFVMGVLVGLFKHSPSDAIDLAQVAHDQGSAVIGRYTLEIAETRVDMATRLARSQQYPLGFRIEMEPEAKPSSPGP
jgi:ATP-dependent Clp protease adaptor protein ClpS